MTYQKLYYLIVAVILNLLFFVHFNTVAEENIIKIGSLEETCKLYVDDPSTPFKLWANKNIETTAKVAATPKDFTSCMNDEEKFTVDIFLKPDNAIGCICNSNKYTNLIKQTKPGDTMTFQGIYGEISNKFFKGKGLICYVTLSDCRFRLEPEKQ